MDTIKFKASTAMDVTGCVIVTGFMNKQPGFSIGETQFVTIKYSKAGDTLWVREFGDLTPGVTSIPLAVIVNEACDVYVTGVTNASGTADFITVKYDSSGNELWVETFDEGEFDQANAIALDHNGNVYVTGVSENAGNLDFLTIKYDMDGDDFWDARFDGDGNGFDQSKAIVVSGDSVYVTGESTGSGTSLDFVTINYNAITGNEEWVAEYSGSASGMDQPVDIAVDGQKNVYVTGRSSETGTGFDMTTIKYNSSGVEQWVNNFHRSGSNADEAFALVLDQQGNVYITGTSGTGWFEFPRTSVQIDFDILDFDYITIKYNSVGVQQWMQSFDGPAGGIDAAFDIDLDSSNNVYVTGLSQSVDTLPAGFSFGFGVDFANSAIVIGSGFSIISTFPAPPVNVGPAPADATTIKYDSNGNEQWVERFVNPEPGSWSGAMGIEVDEDASVYVTGFSALMNPSVPTFGVKLTTIKYSVPMPISISVAATDESCEAAGEGLIDLTVTGGIPPYTFLWSNGATTEDVSGLNAGNYTVIVKDNIGISAIESAVINDPPPDPKDPASCSELFISEYVEGTGHNTAIELYNPTDDPIALNNYFLRVFMNGGPTRLIQQLVGVVLPKQTFVISHPNAGAYILAVADQTSNKINFNGDDPVQLIKVLNNISINIDSIEGIGGNPHAIFDTLDLDTLDHVGIPGVWPGNQGYPVGSGTTKNSTLIRNPGVTSGKEDWACGQKQWRVNGVDDASNLKQHQCICAKAALEIIYSFENPTETQDSIGNDIFEFDIYVSSNVDTTYFSFAILHLKYDTTAFGPSIKDNNNILVTLTSPFNIPSYLDPMISDYSVDTARIIINPDVAAVPFTRVQLTPSPIPFLHVKIKIKQCNQLSGLMLTSPTSSVWSNFMFAPSTSPGFGAPYDIETFSNDIDLILCEMNIFQFTSPVYPGTWYQGTTETGWELTILGTNFDSTRGNGNVYFINANKPNAPNPYTPLNAYDFISWTDSEIKIRMPSVIDSSLLFTASPMPGSGIFYVKNNAGDSASSDIPIDMPYGIKNHIDPIGGYEKIRIDILNKDPSDSIAITFRLGTSITNNINPKVEPIVRKAVREWACGVQVYFVTGAATSNDSTGLDGVSVIHLTNSLPSNKLAVTQIFSDTSCNNISGNKVVFAAEIDIAIKETPASGAWFYDTTQSDLPSFGFDFYEVILHEVGHAVLLKHVNYEDLMFPIALIDTVADIPGGFRRLINGADADGGFNVVTKGISVILDPSCTTAGPLIELPSDFSACVTPTGVEELLSNSNNLPQIIIYPNPADEVLYLKGDDKLSASFLLYDITGRKIMEHAINSGYAEISLRGLSGGLYLYRINTNDGISVNGKLIKN